MANAFDRLRPDFEADTRLPQWVQMGDGEQQQAPDMSPFMAALKKRMQPQSVGGAGSAMGGALGGMTGGATKAGGGGMQSL